MAEKSRDLILASASAARRALLTQAGLSFDVIPANIDEDAIKSAVFAADPYAAPQRVAEKLAGEKARAVSRGHPGVMVIGADQVLVFENTIYSKADTIAEARAILKKLRGRSHELISGAALARDGDVLWSGCQSARLTMREFSDAFLADYLEMGTASILSTVGCYELEGRGVHLFESIDGDYFTILGLPLLPLLNALRSHQQVKT